MKNSKLYWKCLGKATASVFGVFMGFVVFPTVLDKLFQQWGWSYGLGAPLALMLSTSVLLSIIMYNWSK